MKRINILICFIIISLGWMITSCHDDLSTLDVKEVPGVEIDTTGMKAFSVHQFDYLVVEPNLVKAKGLSESNLSYEWRINLIPGDTTFHIIGDQKNLNYEVRFKPNVSGNYHLLYYTITDKSTGLEYIMSWPVTVKNNIGEGLVIAETSDGINTDISHIMHSLVTTDYTGESVKHNVYSSINSGTIKGLIKQMRFTKMYGVDVLLGITDNSITRINTLDYTLSGTNGELFYSNSSGQHPQALGGIVQGDMYVADGKLTGTYLGASRKFGLPFDFTYKVPDHIAFNGFNYYPLPIRINFYDEANQHFVYLPTIMSFGDNKMHPVPADTEGVFDPATVTNKVNLAAGVSTGGDFLHLLKDKSSGDIGLYVLDGGQDNYPSPIPRRRKHCIAYPRLRKLTKQNILSF
ncbi:PKD-like family lipoprotein [Pontibacter pudoricolor]|uniref:PKD-like family lipoprotein n=1 Tax=Pontibacter pudoricolor TaxID=2694930 RepID=UPI00192E94A9|nr:PKD-like family lipoprotein [Pontibacter pudoricolor]